MANEAAYCLCRTFIYSFLSFYSPFPYMQNADLADLADTVNNIIVVAL